MSDRLHPADVEVIAGRVAQLVLAELEPRRPQALLTAAEVAAYLAVEAEWVRDHANMLGAVRLGDGPRARLRFRLERVDAAMASVPGTRAPQSSSRRRRRSKSSGDVVPLLPIRGGDAA